MVRTTFDWKSIVLSEPFVTGTRNEGPFVPRAKAVPAKRSERDMETRMAKLLLRIWSTVNKLTNLGVVKDSQTSISPCFLVEGICFGNPNSQMLQNIQIAPNMANPSHQFPTQRVSRTVNEVWTPSSTNIDRKLETHTNPTTAPEAISRKENIGTNWLVRQKPEGWLIPI